jgi:hypothetical protein
VANAREPRYRLVIIERLFGLRLRDQVKHPSGLIRTGLRNC